ncbi:MAG TPA: cupin domain-containing protein [Bryobacteraceae bacterium]|nr:cupin domain-containing protein [Bryobacteraceae bacterium]
MFRTWPVRCLLQLTIAAVCFMWIGAVSAADLNPAAIFITPPNDIKWVEGNGGAANAILAGDPSKPGLYVELTKWHPGHMSRPHFHQYDRYIYVISGTWWVGTGTKYDPDSTKPVPPGSFVTHYAKQIHYDGSKQGDTVLEIVGMGPATSIPAEVK